MAIMADRQVKKALDPSQAVPRIVIATWSSSWKLSAQPHQQNHRLHDFHDMTVKAGTWRQTPKFQKKLLELKNQHEFIRHMPIATI